MNIETKTKAYYGKRPCFINGTLPRPGGIEKVLVYWFDEEGELRIELKHIRYVYLKDFQLN